MKSKVEIDPNIRETAQRIMTVLVQKSAAGSDIDHEIRLWDDPETLARIAFDCAVALETVLEEEK